MRHLVFTFLPYNFNHSFYLFAERLSLRLIRIHHQIIKTFFGKHSNHAVLTCTENFSEQLFTFAYLSCHLIHACGIVFKNFCYIPRNKKRFFPASINGERMSIKFSFENRHVELRNILFTVWHHECFRLIVFFLHTS